MSLGCHQADFSPELAEVNGFLSNSPKNPLANPCFLTLVSARMSSKVCKSLLPSCHALTTSLHPSKPLQPSNKRTCLVSQSSMILGVKLLNNGQIIKNQVEVEISLSSYLQPESVVLVIVFKIANTYINRNRIFWSKQSACTSATKWPLYQALFSLSLFPVM